MALAEIRANIKNHVEYGGCDDAELLHLALSETEAEVERLKGWEKQVCSQMVDYKNQLDCANLQVRDAVRIIRDCSQMLDQGGYGEKGYEQALEDLGDQIGEPWITAHVLRRWLRDHGDIK